MSAVVSSRSSSLSLPSELVGFLTLGTTGSAATEILPLATKPPFSVISKSPVTSMTLAWNETEPA